MPKTHIVKPDMFYSYSCVDNTIGVTTVFVTFSMNFSVSFKVLWCMQSCITLPKSTY